MIDLGKGAKREVEDYHLTRYGAYLTVMNGDPNKPEIAAAQHYFARARRVMDGYSYICERCGARHELEPIEDEGGLYDLCSTCRELLYGADA